MRAMIIGHIPAVRFSDHVNIQRGLRLCGREETWKTDEILILRHSWRSYSGGGRAAQS